MPKGLGASIDDIGNRWVAAGKKAQWAGSIMTYAITVPLAAALYVGMRASNQLQTSLAALHQAYNENGAGATDMAARQRAWARDSSDLEKIILKLSNAYGIAQPEVAGIAAELARAGDRSTSLATDLDTVTRMMRTYGVQTTVATQIVSQSRAAWGASAAATRDNTNALSVFQEVSRGSFDQLAQGVNKVSQPARAMGLTYKETAAYVALLLQQVNSTGGSTLGNTLTTVFSRLFAVVPKASKLLKEYGLNVNSVAYENGNAAQKLQLIADKWSGLSRAQQATLAIALAGQRQFRGLLPILNDMSDKNSQYNKTLQETASHTANAAFANRQLAFAMQTPSAQFAVIKTNLENLAIGIARDLTPALLYVGRLFEAGVHWFTNLPKGVQQFALIALAVAAVAGPVMKLGGVFVILGGTIFKAASSMISALPLLFGPIGVIAIILGVVLTAVVLFHGRVLTVFQDLAQGIGFIVHAIYQLFQWINPFARHSPSLVENVSSGVDAMLADFTRLGAGVSPIMTSIGKTIEDTGAAASSMSGGFSSTSLSNAHSEILKGVKAGAVPVSAIGTFDSGVAQLDKLAAAMKLVGAAYDAQSEKVKKLKKDVTDSNDALQNATLALKALQDQKNDLTNKASTLGSSTALYSQAASLKDMGRQIAASGNDALARRYAEQAAQLQSQGDQAAQINTNLTSVNAQIDAQTAVVATLTATHDALTQSYTDENQKLADLSSGYAEMKAQYSQLNTNLLQMGTSAHQATVALKQAAAAAAGLGAGGPAGAGNAPALDLKSEQGNLSDWLKNFKDQTKLPQLPNFGEFFAEMKKSYDKGWAQFGKMSLPAKIFSEPIILALAVAVPLMLLKMSSLLGGLFTKLRGLVGLGAKSVGDDIAKALGGHPGAGKNIGNLGKAGKVAGVAEGAAGDAAALAGGAEGAVVAGEGAAASGGLASIAAASGPLLLVAAAVSAISVGIGHLDGDVGRYKKAQEWIHDFTQFKDAQGPITDALNADGGAIGATTEKMISMSLQSSGLADKASKLGVNLGQLTVGVTGSNDQFNTMIATLQHTGKLTPDLALGLNDLRNKYLASAQSVAAAKKKQDELNASLAYAAAVTNGQMTVTDLLSGKYDNLNTKSQTLAQTQLAFNSDLLQVTASVRAHGSILDGDSAAATSNRNAIMQTAEAALRHSQNVYQSEVGTLGATRAMQDALGVQARSRQAFMDVAGAAGLSAQQAGAIYDKLVNLNGVKNPNKTVTVNNGQALQALSDVNRALNGVIVSAGVVTQYINGIGVAGARVGMKFATYSAAGGEIRGPGTATSDSIPAMLSNGEFVINAAAYAKNRAAVQALNEGRTDAALHALSNAFGHGAHKLAAGGEVGRNPFMQIFANTVAPSLVNTMNRANKMNAGMSMSNVNINSNNTTTNNITVNVPPAPQHGASAEDVARALGRQLTRSGVS
ncbi:MAG: phage tail tape measure protein [Pseudomonadota bacterium]|nr:phage tail tape measure protein [Pseudomonadota bacterium]